MPSVKSTVFCGQMLLGMTIKKGEASFRENVKKAFSAFSFEHSAEMLSTYRKCQVLSGGTIEVAYKKHQSAEEKMMADST